jgi:hypothetical protein
VCFLPCSANPSPPYTQVGGKAFLINHFEAPQPSTAYISELAADRSGKLRIVNTAPVDDTAQDVQGLWFMCRGEKTPWGTHIGGEEYPPDCEWLMEPALVDRRGTLGMA